MSGSFPHKSSRVASSDHFRISFLCPVAEEGDKEGKEDKEEKEKSDSKSDKSEDKEDGVWGLLIHGHEMGRKLKRVSSCCE